MLASKECNQLITSPLQLRDDLYVSFTSYRFGEVDDNQVLSGKVLQEALTSVISRNAQAKV